MKKIISLLLSLVMMVSLAIPASAASSITSTESNNSASTNVTANYTPTEARWGASSTDLNIGSGTLAQAIAAAASSSDVKYIQLQTNVTTTDGYMIDGGTFTLDLNGKAVSNSGSACGFNICDDGVDVTLTDTAGGGKVTTGSSPAVWVNGGKLTVSKGTYESTGHDAVRLASGTVVIDDGDFTSTHDGAQAVNNSGGNLTINGGSFSGKLGTVGINGGTTTVKGGTFTASSYGHIGYWSGKLDLSNYNGTTALTDLTVYTFKGVATVGDDTIKLPGGYAFYKSDDTNKTAVDELAAGVKYAIKSTSGDEGGDMGGSDKGDGQEAWWGTSKSDLTRGGTLAQALAAAKINSAIKYIQLQANVTATSSYMITGGSFTLDLNGKTISSSTYTIIIGDKASNNESGIDVTFTDTATGGKVETTSSASAAFLVQCGKVTFESGNYGSINMSASGNAVPNAEVVINGGSFTHDDGTAVMNVGGTLTINSGSFSGKNYAISTSGTTTIKGGSFEAEYWSHIIYSGGKLDLSNYNGTTAITDLTVENHGGAVAVGDTTVNLPKDYAFYDVYDADKSAVTELAAGDTYAIKSTSGDEGGGGSGGGTTTKYDVVIDSNITNGTVTANPASAAEGDTVTLTLSCTSGYMITALTITDANGDDVGYDVVNNNVNSGSATCTFIMPASNVTVSATFEKYPEITGVTVKVGETTYTSGNVILTSDSGDVVFTLSGTDFARLLMSDNTEFGFRYSGYVEGVIVRQLVDQLGATVDPTANTATYTVGSDDFSELTGAVEVVYSNNGAANTDGASWTGTGIYLIYQAETTSVEITWGSMSFTYSDEQTNGADKGWTCESNANTVKVENKGTVTVKAEVKFEKKTETANINNVTGSFGNNSTATLAKDESATFTLSLTGKPDGALTNATIGTVTVTITKATGTETSGTEAGSTEAGDTDTSTVPNSGADFESSGGITEY